MIKKMFIFIILLFLATGSFAALTYDRDYYVENRRFLGTRDTALDPLYNIIGELETELEASTLEGGLLHTFSTHGGTFGQSANNVFTWTETPSDLEDLLLTFSANAVAWSSGSGVLEMSLGTIILDLDKIKVAAVTYTLPTSDGSAGQQLTTDSSGVLTWAAAGAGTFTGGAITGNITLDDTIEIRSHGTATDYASIVAYDTGVGYINVLKWTDAATPEVLLGHADASFALASTGVDISTAGAVSGVTTLGIGGNVTLENGLILDQSIDTVWRWTEGGEDLAWTFGTDVVTVSSSLGVVSIDWGALAPTFGAQIVATSGMAANDDITLADGKALQTSTTSGQTGLIQVYDNDTGPGYKDAITLTNGNTPAMSFGANAMTVAVDSSDWDISTTGAMTGIGAITSDGLATLALGATVSGATINLNASSNFTVNIGSGTATGTITIGGTGTQSIDIGNGAGIKTVALGSATTSSATAINAGTGDMTITSVDDMTINGGSAGSIINLGTNTQGNVINVGTDDTTLDDINIGSAKDTPQITGISVGIAAGTSDLTVTSTDDLTINGGSAGSILNLMTNTQGNVINIATDDTTLDDLNIGSAKDTVSITGVDVTLVSGATGVLINNDTNQLVGIGTGTSTGTVTIGGAAAQIITIGNGAAAKTVTLGSSDSTSTTNILAGSGNINITGSVVRTAQQIVQTIGYCKVGTTGGWVVPAASDAAHLATLPQSQTASTLIIPITIPLKVGWTITAWTINGQIDAAGNTATLDAKLYKHTEATAGFANAAIGSGMAQLSKVGDYKVVEGEASLTEVVAADESYYLLVTGTTAATTDIEIASLTITVSEI